MQLRNALTTLILAAPVFANVHQARQNNNDPNQTLQLDPSIVMPAGSNDGQDEPTAGQVASLTSGNNQINFCAQFKDAITNGQQNRDGSCNPMVMGRIPSFNNMPSQSFVTPKNNDVITAGQDLQFTFKTRNWQAGFFTNPTNTYYMAPQQLNAQGQIIGHSHVTCVDINGLDDTEPVDTRVFAFFKGLNEPVDGNGLLKATAPGGLDPGTYMCCLMGAASNHQGWLMPVAQRGPHDPCIRFTVQAAGGGNGGNAGGNAAGNGGQGNGGAADGAGAGGGAGGAAGGNGGNTGNAGGNTGGNTGGNAGVNTGNAGGNTGGNTGNTGGGRGGFRGGNRFGGTRFGGGNRSGGGRRSFEPSARSNIARSV